MKKQKKKINAEYCPNCKDTEMIKVEGGKGQVEIFKCENCKFIKNIK